MAQQVEARGIERWIVAFIGMAIIAAILTPPLFSIGKWAAIAAVIVCFALIPTIADGFIVKLRLLGIEGLTDTVFKLLQWVYTIVIFPLTFFATRKHSNSSRLIKVQIWIAILVLASLRSPVAPSAYVVVPALFLLALLAGEIHGRIIYGFGFFLAWILIMGVPPLPDRPELMVDLISQSLTMVICIWVLVRRSQTQMMPEARYQMPVAT
ncbi:hypothetical protein L0244_29440 [bacterium]|nr:hypothetical protein [bacterium]